MYQEKDEQVIFIKDLIFAVLYRWRSVLAVAIALAMLLGGYKVFSGMTAGSATTVETEQPVDMQLLKERIERETLYLEESILMNMDAFQTGKAIVSINIITENLSKNPEAIPTGYVQTIMATYADLLIDHCINDAAAKALGIESKYLSELVSVSTSENSTIDGTVTLTVTHSDLQVARDIATYLTDALPEITQQVQELVVPHAATSYVSSSVQIDTNILEKQNKERTYLSAIKAEYEAKKTAEPAAASTLSKKELLKDGILFSIIGGILGACLAAGIIWVCHFAGTKVYSSRTLTAWTGVGVLCRVPGKLSKNPIDRWLRKLEGRAGEDKLPVAAATIRNYTTPGQTLLVCADSGCPKNVMTSLCKENPQLRLCGGLTQDVSALEALGECEKVLLAVCCGKTVYSDVSQQARLIRDQHKELIGCIVIDG